jgi:hypothetical protein
VLLARYVFALLFDEFSSHPGRCLSWFSSVFPGDYRDKAFKICDCLFLPNPFPLIVAQSSYLSTLHSLVK